MQQPPSILVYGREPGLLQSRSWVLQTAGFRVASVESLVDARRLAATGSFELLVLCHTLNPQDWREALAWADTLPGMKRVLLTTGALPFFLPRNEEVLSQFAGSRELIGTIHRLLPVEQPV